MEYVDYDVPNNEDDQGVNPDAEIPPLPLPPPPMDADNVLPHI